MKNGAMDRTAEFWGMKMSFFSMALHLSGCYNFTMEYIIFIVFLNLFI